MSLKPQDVRLHQVDTSKGEWGVFVQSVVESRNGERLFLIIVLEQNIDDEHVRSRKLEMSVAASDLANPLGRTGLLNQIRNWIETTEGDGSLVGI
jgi:hypothetical protein